MLDNRNEREKIYLQMHQTTNKMRKKHNETKKR